MRMAAGRLWWLFGRERRWQTPEAGQGNAARIRYHGHKRFVRPVIGNEMTLHAWPGIPTRAATPAAGGRVQAVQRMRGPRTAMGPARHHERSRIQAGWRASGVSQRRP